MKLIQTTLSVALLALALSACSNGDNTSRSIHGDLLTVDKLPAVLEGEITADVMEGDEDVGEYAEHNFGTLKVENGDIPIYVHGRVMAASGLPPTGGRARATLSEKTEEYGPTTYVVSKLEKL